MNTLNEYTTYWAQTSLYLRGQTGRYEKGANLHDVMIVMHITHKLEDNRGGILAHNNMGFHFFQIRITWCCVREPGFRLID